MAAWRTSHLLKSPFRASGCVKCMSCAVFRLAAGGAGDAGEGALVHLPMEILPDPELLQRQQARAAERDRISGRLAAAVAEEPYSLQLVRAFGVPGVRVGGARTTCRSESSTPRWLIPLTGLHSAGSRAQEAERPACNQQGRTWNPLWPAVGPAVAGCGPCPGDLTPRPCALQVPGSQPSQGGDGGSPPALSRCACCVCAHCCCRRGRHPGLLE